MFFTKLGTVAAWIMLAMGALRVATGVYVGTNLSTPGFDPAYFLGSTIPGHAIDWGVIVVLCGISLGVLTEISRSVRQTAPAPAEKHD
jgi:uncharacterized membrane protein